MSIPTSLRDVFIGANAAGGSYQIEHSLKFNSNASQYLYHDLSGTPSGTTHGSLSCWIKGTRPGYYGPTTTTDGWNLWESDSNPGSPSSGTDWYTNCVPYNAGFAWGDMSWQSAANAKGVANYWTLNTTSSYMAYRDLTGWCHVLTKWQSGDGTSNRRQIVYVNGVESVYYNYYGTIGSNEACYFTRNGYRISLGEGGNADFIIAEAICVDGTEVSPTDFYETDSITGEIKPKEYTGTFGNNGWYLKFDPSAANGIGHDHSGNGKHFTATGFTTSGNDTDVLSDSPTNNWCNFNQLYASQNRNTNRISKGGTHYVSTGGGVVWATQVPNCPPIYQGKWYWEWVQNSTDAYIGLISDTVNAQTSGNTQSESGTILYYAGDGNKRIDNSASSYGSSYKSTDLPSWSNYVGVALDKDNNTVTFYKSGVSQGSIALSSSSVDMVNRPVLPAFLLLDASSRGNFGQFDFQMTPPAGYKAINQANWPEPSIKNPREHFNVVTWSGNGASSRAITGVGFQPDFVWVKRRNSNTYVHILFDVVRGAGNQFTTNGTAAELASASNVAGKVSSFDSDGFTVASGSSNNFGVNQSGGTYVAYCWKAGGSGVSNTDGSQTSTVSVNQTAGFSLVNYDSSASTKPITVGHGLGEKPRFIMFKNRDSAGSWAIYHAETGATKAAALNSTSAPTTSIDYFNNTEPTDTVFTGYDSTPTNQYGTTNTCFAFCWAEKEGYSKFGRYTGVGNKDGTFVPCGFRPAWVLVKCFSTSGDSWYLWDDTRRDYNVTNLGFPVDAGSQEDTSLGTDSTGNYSIDICANGFKHKALTTPVNGSGRTYMFAAFARCPWKYATGGVGRDVG